ncbi:MltR family transcriptional regulator [Vibrio pacinii]|uniref:MltR family transcriptional regulator n=1 Tax=Vibrio pacinii TaxID=170674 RepID=UPI00056F1E43|nr:MltR family transcriptional regulator [Vibrio pacinii]
MDIEESDRGVVITSVADVENLLDKMLKLVFTHNNVSNKRIKSMFDASGPLSTFSSKYQMLYAFGYIRHDNYTDLELLKKLRNKLAHTTGLIRLESEEVAQILKLMSFFKAGQNQMDELVGLKRNRKEVYISKPDISEHEAAAMGLIKRSKSDFGIGISILKSRLVSDLERKLENEN